MISGRRSDAFREIKVMRVLAILALALSLAGCNGDRMKDSNLRLPSSPAVAKLFAWWRASARQSQRGKREARRG